MTLLTTIEQAKQYIFSNIRKGVRCPCCNGHVKVYKRPLHSGMIQALFDFYHAEKKILPTDGWLHVKNDIADGKSYNGEYAKLRFWGLLEKAEGGGRGSGYWRITALGRQFVEGTATVPANVWTLHNESIFTDPTQIDIKQAIGNGPFTYETLKAGEIKF